MAAEVVGEYLSLAEEGQCKRCQGKVMLPLYWLKYLK